MGGTRAGLLLLWAFLWPSALWAEDAKPAPAAPPIEADFKISDKMAVDPAGIDLDAGIKPNLKPVHRRPKALSQDELCSMTNIQQLDLGRGMPTALPKACRGKVPVSGSIGLKNGSPY